LLFYNTIINSTPNTMWDGLCCILNINDATIFATEKIIFSQKLQR